MVGYYRRPINNFSTVKSARRRPLARNSVYADSNYMPFNEVMESFYTFVRVYDYQDDSIERQAAAFCNKYERVSSYKDLIIQRAKEDMNEQQ